VKLTEIIKVVDIPIPANANHNQHTKPYLSTVFSVLTSKFKDFARNTKIVHLDDISSTLREYFMNMNMNQLQAEEQTQARLSLTKLVLIFPKLTELHLHNYYKLDNELLEHILNFFEQRDCYRQNISQIKFLYYDYECEEEIDEDSRQDLNQELLK
jgi:N-glycosylase/DNA lyase